MIFKEDFLAYEKIRLSGKTNMFDVRMVALLGGLEPLDVKDIMKHYSEYKEVFMGE